MFVVEYISWFDFEEKRWKNIRENIIIFWENKEEDGRESDFIKYVESEFFMFFF